MFPLYLSNRKVKEPKFNSLSYKDVFILSIKEPED